MSITIGRLINTPNISINDAIDVRIIIESNAAELAALNATTDELDALDVIRQKLDEQDFSNE